MMSLPSLSLHSPSQRVLRVSLLAFALVCSGLVVSLLDAPAGARASGCGACGPFELTHIATPANSAWNFTQMDTSVINGQPAAVLVVTPNWSVNGIYDNHPLGVFYSAPYWYIFHQDGAPIPTGAAFNVGGYRPWPSRYGFVQVATSANSSSNSTWIDRPDINGHPDAHLFVTPHLTPGGSTVGAYNNHPIGVGYNRLSGRWDIFNQDGAPMPTGAAFNVEWDTVTDPTNLSVGSQWATRANSFADYTVIDNPWLNGQPAAIIQVTPEANPSMIVGLLGVSDPHNIGVFYDGSHWCIFNQDGTPIPPAAVFFYRLY